MRIFFGCYCLLAASAISTALAQAPSRNNRGYEPAAALMKVATTSAAADREPWPYLPEDFELLERYRLAHPPLPSHADSVYTYAEQMPVLSGQTTFRELVETLRRAVVAPADAPAGRLFVQFEVSRQGLVSQPRIMKSLRADLDSAVLKATRQLPRFTPGRQGGHTVPVRLSVPVTFGEVN